LELYALHRQAVSGDAPTISTNNNQQWNATDRAKYNAWKSKAGLSTMMAMQQYIQEADRQVRVYGTATTATSGSTSAVQSKNINDASQSGGYTAQQQQQSHSNQAPPPPTSRGLAAIPLLCAAASEQRVSYLRRIQTTSYHNAWWKRQEPLLAPPFTILAIPEHILLYIATIVETISLYVTYTHVTNEATSTNGTGHHNAAQSNTGSTALASSTKTNSNTTNGGTINTRATTLIPHIVGVTVQSYLWPFHNVLLSTWMTVILTYMITSTSIQCMSTILLGSRRTGLTLHTIYHEQILFICQSIYTIMESHQPVSVRCIGLLFLPYTFLLRVLRTINPTLATTTTSSPSQPPDTSSASSSVNSNSLLLVSCSAYSILIGMTIWYWLWIVPCLVIFGMDYICSILLLGPCFAIIELASQL
jgi:acyl-CoA-binding protein